MVQYKKCLLTGPPHFQSQDKNRLLTNQPTNSGFSMKVFSIKILTKHQLQNLDRTKTSKFVPNLASESRLSFDFITSTIINISFKTRSSWLNCALRDDEAVYWVSIGHYEAVAVGNWWYWVSRGHSCLYILHKVEIWTGVTDALLIKYKSGALVTQYWPHLSFDTLNNLQRQNLYQIVANMFLFISISNNNNINKFWVASSQVRVTSIKS